MKPTFSQLCHRYASSHPYLPWKEACKRVSAMLRPRKATPVQAQQNRLWYRDN